MTAARKISAFNFVVRRSLGWILRRRFHAIYVFGAEHLRTLPVDSPVIGCVNHTNWWDGFVLYILSWRLLPHDIYLAMEEKNLRRYRFFTWMGVFGIDLVHKASVLSGIRYALGLLNPRALLWFFVQGRLLPAGRRIEALPGATYLAKRKDALLLPMVLRYEWLNESRPSIFVVVSKPLAGSTSADELSIVLNDSYARLDEKLDPIDLSDAMPLFPPKMSLNKRWDYLRHLFGKEKEVFERQNR